MAEPVLPLAEHFGLVYRDRALLQRLRSLLQRQASFVQIWGSCCHLSLSHTQASFAETWQASFAEMWGPQHFLDTQLDKFPTFQNLESRPFSYKFTHTILNSISGMGADGGAQSHQHYQ